jgi:membrane protein
MAIPGLGGMSARAFLGAVARTAVRDGIVDLAAQLAYYGILSLFPFTAFLVTLLGFLPIAGLEDEIFRILGAMMPIEAAALFEGTVRGLVTVRRGGVLALSVVGSVVAASGGVSALITALDRAYGVAETRSWVRLRATALGITLVAAVLIVVATVALIIGPDWAHRAGAWFGLEGIVDPVWRWLRWPAILVAISSLLAFLYWACPDVDHQFRYLTPGSVAGVLLWVVASLGFSAYATRLGNYNRTYGALAAGIVLLTWIYISSLIVLLGGVMNAVVWCASGRPTPDEARAEARRRRARFAEALARLAGRRPGMPTPT